LSRSVLIGRGAPRWAMPGAGLAGYYTVAERRAAQPGAGAEAR
jgi:hypothetical protein